MLGLYATGPNEDNVTIVLGASFLEKVTGSLHVARLLSGFIDFQF